MVNSGLAPYSSQHHDLSGSPASTLGGSSYGPVMWFVCGTEFASPGLTKPLAATHA